MPNLKRKVDENILSFLRGKAIDINGDTPLTSACHTGHLDIVKWFIEKCNVTVNGTAQNGSFPLWVAACENHVSLVDYLLNRKADVNLTTLDGTTSLYIACDRGHEDVVRKLLKHDADVNTLHKQNNTSALWIACRRGYFGIVSILCTKGADIHNKSNDGESTLYTASEFGRRDVVELLLQNGSDVHCKSLKGKVPLQVACENNHLEVVEALVAGGADLNVQGPKKITPVMYAAQNGHINVVKYLVEEVNADINLCSDDIDGGTALHYAVANNYMKTATYLINREIKYHKNAANELPSQLARRKGHVSMYDMLCLQESQDDRNKKRTSSHGSRVQVYSAAESYLEPAKSNHMPKDRPPQSAVLDLTEIKQRWLSKKDLEELDVIYAEVMRQIKNNLSSGIISINKGRTVKKIFIAHQGNNSMLSKYLQETFPKLSKDDIFVLENRTKSFTFAGKVVIVKSDHDTFPSGSTSCFASDGSNRFILTSKHLLDFAGCQVQTGPNTCFHGAEMVLSSCPTTWGYFGEFTFSDKDMFVDILLIEITFEIAHLSQIDVHPVPSELVAVYKYGATTDYTEGSILNDNSGWVVEGGRVCGGFFVVVGSDGKSKFADKGDSGALVRLGTGKDAGAAIGLVFATEEDFLMDGKYTIPHITLCVSLEVQLQAVSSLWGKNLRLFEADIGSSLFVMKN